MRYELSDYEWSVITPLLPNKPRAIARVDDGRILNGIFWVLPLDAARIERAWALARKHHCLFCHNSDFSGHDNVPRLAAQREDYLLKALREYKANTRPGYDASMAEVVQPLGDAELVDLAYLIAHAQ